MERSATLSRDGVYRYDLVRRWSDTGPTCVWIMLNPSTADAEVDDPTIRRCIGFAQRGDFGAIAVVNLFAYRATKPAHLWAAAASGIDTVGPENADYLRRWVTDFEVGLVMAAWGAGFSGNLPSVLAGVPLHCLGTTKGGHPRHPLYVKSTQSPTPWLPSPVPEEE